MQFSILAMSTGARSVMAVITLAVIPTLGFADRVQFDATPTASCQTLDAADSDISLGAQEKLIVVRVQISSLLAARSSSAIGELFYRFESPERNLRIADYLPKTTMATPYGGNIRVEENDEKSQQISLGVGADVQGFAHLNGGLTRGTIDRRSLKYDLLPPHELLAAAGTTGRGSGAYFKLRPSQQISLEGAREFVLMLKVPESWRGDYLRVLCSAYAEPTQGHGAELGNAAFLVPLYLAGDVEAQAAAERLTRAERRFLSVVAQQHGEIAKRSQPTIVHELSLANRVIPVDWLSQLAHRSVLVDETPPFEAHLPPSVRQAASEFQLAKRQLHELAGTFLTAAPQNHPPSTQKSRVSSVETSAENPSL